MAYLKNKIEEHKKKQEDFASKMAKYIHNPVEFVLDTWYGYFVSQGIPGDRVELAVDTWQQEVLMALAEHAVA
jgi:hypothetical protein